jgi:hypothetical protein
MAKYYFQVILEDTKEIEKKYIDMIEELLKDGMSKKELLFKFIDSLNDKQDDESQYNDLVENINHKHIDLVEEIKDLKLMIKGLSVEGVKVVKEEKEKNENILGFDNKIDKNELSGIV